MANNKIGYFRLTFQGLGTYQYAEKVVSSGTAETLKRWYEQIGHPIISVDLIRWITSEEMQQSDPCSCY